MAHRNRNDFDSTGDSSDAEDALGRSVNDKAEDLERPREVGPDTPGSPQPAAELERKLAEAQDRFLRQAAEYDNYRKRTIKERTELVPRAQADIVKQLLDPLDDLARFAHVDPSTVEPATVVQGAEMVEKKMQKGLLAAGLE